MRYVLILIVLMACISCERQQPTLNEEKYRSFLLYSSEDYHDLPELFEVYEDMKLGFDQAFPQIEVTTYADLNTTVLYVSSRTLDSLDVTLDLSKLFANAASISGVKVSLDTSTTEGLQWDNGIATEGITVDGRPYFYNEHQIFY